MQDSVNEKVGDITAQQSQPVTEKIEATAKTIPLPTPTGIPVVSGSSAIEPPPAASPQRATTAPDIATTELSQIATA